MICGIDLERWLRARSTDVRSLGTEIQFTHSPKLQSILVERQSEPVGETIQVRNQELRSFYRRFLGGSLFNSFLILASPVKSGVPLSTGLRLPDLEEVKQSARQHGLHVSDADELFLVGSAWMFLYAPGSTPDAPLRCYDRDYRAVSEDRTLEQVLSQAWSLMIA